MMTKAALVLVLKVLDARNNMLDLIKATVKEHSEAGFLVERCKQYDLMLREQILEEYPETLP